MIYLQLFAEFFLTGLFSIGGGMATIPFLQSMAVKTGWFNAADLANMVAVAESTPGPMGVNTATYVGYKVGFDLAGVPTAILGSVVATLGLITPGIIVICIVAYFLEKFRTNPVVDAAFYGLRPASVGLISAAGFSIVLICFFKADSIQALLSAFTLDWRHVVWLVVILVLTNVKKLKKLHPIWFILLSAVVGILFGFAQ